VRWANLFLQIEPTRLRSTMADLAVIVYEHLDGTLTIGLRAAYGGPLRANWRVTHPGSRPPFAAKRGASASVTPKTLRPTGLRWAPLQPTPLSWRQENKRQKTGTRAFPMLVVVVNELCSEQRPTRVLQKPAIFTC
jgi:hypothetical protein